MYRFRSFSERIGIFLAFIVCLTALYHSRNFFLVQHWIESQGAAESVPFLNSLSLTERQCASAFPELNKEIDRALSQGPFDLNKVADDYSGSVQGRIKNGKVCNLTVFH